MSDINAIEVELKAGADLFSSIRKHIQEGAAAGKTALAVVEDMLQDPLKSELVAAVSSFMEAYNESKTLIETKDIAGGIEVVSEVAKAVLDS